MRNRRIRTGSTAEEIRSILNAHGRTWTASYDLSPGEERRFIEDNIASQ